MSNKYEELYKESEKQLIKIVKDAEKDGYKFINNKFIKEDTVPVVEYFTYYKSYAEEDGDHFMRHGYKLIDEETYNKIKSAKHDNKTIVDYIVCDLLVGNENSYNLYGIDYLDENYITNVLSKSDMEESYKGLYDKTTEECCLEFEFDNGYSIKGYMSIFKMKLENYSFLKEHNCDQKIDCYKYLRWNRTWGEYLYER